MPSCAILKGTSSVFSRRRAPEGFARLAVQSFLVETPSARVVVDTCVGNGKQRSNPLFHMLDTDFLERLEPEAGWAPDSVDVVVCTHLHVDHVGWNTRLQGGAWAATFPNARYWVAEADMPSQRSGRRGDDFEQLVADSVEPIGRAGQLVLAKGSERVAEGVRLRRTPGHTTGHLSVELESEDERALITGDAFHHPSQIVRPDWTSGVDADPATAVATRMALLEELSTSNTLVLGTHFGGPTGGRVVPDGKAWAFLAVDRM